jgi:hypothetical protein
LGDAVFFGSLAGKQLGPGQSIIGIQATRDGKGYWLFNQSGAIISFGDAAVINGGDPLPAADLTTPIVSGAIDVHVKAGAWFTDAGGHVYNVGRAPWYGSHAPSHLAYPMTAITAIPSGIGYWLSNSAGDVWHFGAAVAGEPAPAGVSGTAVGIAPAASRYGYWVATNTGDVITGGDAVTRGESTPTATDSSVVGIVAAPQVYPVIPSGSVGYDVNWPQCAASGSDQTGVMPGPPDDAYGTSAFTIAVIGVDGWAVNDYNSCLAAEAEWAEAARYPRGSHESGTTPYDLYMFLNSPAENSTLDLTGPAGSCDSLSGAAWASCLAYNYGYNAAVAAVKYATAKGAHASIWWLDIENDICAPGMWNDEGNGQWWSCDLSLNATTIQGSIDALRSLDITPGIYCTRVQWRDITGGYVPIGGRTLIWVAGAPYTSPPYPADWGYPGPSYDQNYCTENKFLFADGTPVMLQETPGNGYVYDPDLAC